MFSESTISAKPAQQVAKESGAKYGGVLYVDSLSAKTALCQLILICLTSLYQLLLKDSENNGLFLDINLG